VDFWDILFSFEGFEMVYFCRLMRGLHSAPASSASLECIFSTFEHVWSKQRNRLTKLRNLAKHTVISIITMMNLIGKLVYCWNDCNDMTENYCYVQRAKILTINWSRVQSGISKNVQTH